MRILAALVAASLLAVPCPAQSLVQIALQGEIDVGGGAHVELEVKFQKSPGVDVSMPLALHLAERTSAGDVAALLVLRLKAEGALPLYEPNHTPQRGPAMVFIPDCLGVSARLGRGLSASITLCEDAPASVRILPAQVARSSAHFAVVASGFRAHSKERARLALEWSFEERADAGEIANKLVRDAIVGRWASELESHTTWMPGAQFDGARILGTSLDLRTAGDWRLEVTLPRKRGER